VLNGKNKRKIFIDWIVEFRFDPQTNQWSNDIAPTSSCRTSVGVAVLDGCLFAVGGQDGISCLNLVEK
jgi:kelch-like protein 20